MKKVGLLLIATNKYIDFLQQLVTSADKYFLSNCEVTYYIFTNHTTVNLETNRQFQIIPIEHKPFPYSTLMRYSFFDNASNILSSNDYLFYSDVDMLFVDNVGDEVLSERVVTRHPGYYDKQGNPSYFEQMCGVWNPIETNSNTLACIQPTEDVKYFAGGFNGGSSTEFLKMSNTIATNINKDLSNNIIAKWHDESHLNRYALDNPPTLELSPSYCYGESMTIPFEKKLLALDKNHTHYRT